MRIVILTALVGILCLASWTSSEATTVDREMLKWIRQKPPIDSVQIDGAHHFTAGRVKDQMYSRKRNIWLALRGDRRSRLQRETPRRDSLEVVYLYLVNGFLGAQVRVNYEPIGRDSSVLVRVSLDEGRQFQYGQAEISGRYPDKFDKELHDILDRIETGEPVDPFQLRRVSFDMKTVLANEGYPYAVIDWALDTISTPPRTPVVFFVEADSLVHFGSVTVSGTDIYRESLARRELKIEPGKVYARKDIIESQRRLVESGYFTTMQVRQADEVRDRLRPDFVVRVRERDPHYITGSVGAGQSEKAALQWDISGGLGKRNFLISRKLEVSADWSFSVGRDSRLITHLYRVRFTEPWFLGIRMPLILTGEYEPPIKSTLQDYTIRSFAFSAATTRAFGLRSRVVFGTEYQSVRLTGISEDEIDELKERDGISVRRKLYVNYRSDTRDDIFIPASGQYRELLADYYGGFLAGDADFYKLEGAWSVYRRVWPGWISASRVKVGVTRAFGNSEEVPSDERLYLGGANTIRGFSENSLGPQTADGDARGANYTLILNHEFRWRTLPVFNIFEKWGPLSFIASLFRTLPLWQSVFVDAGNGFARLENVKARRFAVSYGTGLQIMSPAGPIRLDYARRIKTRDIDFDESLHFTILYAF